MSTATWNRIRALVKGCASGSQNSKQQARAWLCFRSSVRENTICGDLLSLWICDLFHEVACAHVGIATHPHSHSGLFFPGLASVEAYNPKTNDWVFVAPMNTRRSSVGVGVVDGKQSCISQVSLNAQLNLFFGSSYETCFGSSPNSTAYKKLGNKCKPRNFSFFRSEKLQIRAVQILSIISLKQIN